MTNKRDELLKQQIDSFPVLPVSVTNLMTVTSNPESSAQDVMKVILIDQSLCLTVLKIANSVLFGRPKKVDSIKKAVTILGFNEVQKIALAKALINSFSKIANQHKSSIDMFWDHSFVCAIVARHIAQDLCVSPDTAFMAGLLHDIGKLIMLETFVDDYAIDWMVNFSNEETLYNELHMFSFTHDTVAGQLLRKWLFPENLITVIDCHHRPEGAGQEKNLAHIIQLADILSHYCCLSPKLGDGDILTAVNSSIPDLQLQWQNHELTLENEAIVTWFHWLVNNYEQGGNLKDAFAA